MWLCSPKVDHLPFKVCNSLTNTATSKSEESALTSTRHSLCKPTEASWRAMKPQNQSTQSVRKQRNKDKWYSAMLLNTIILRLVSKPKGRHTDLSESLFSFTDWLFSLHLENDPSPSENSDSQCLASFWAALPRSPLPSERIRHQIVFTKDISTSSAFFCWTFKKMMFWLLESNKAF